MPAPGWRGLCNATRRVRTNGAKLEQGLGKALPNKCMVKNPDTDLFESLIREKIFEVDEVTDVRDVSVTFSSRKRTAHISYVAYTDADVIRGEVDLNCLIME